VLRVVVPPVANEPAELLVREILVRVNVVGMSTRFLQKLSVVFGVQMDPVLTIEPAHHSHLAW
jgi:hypothetical protein